MALGTATSREKCLALEFSKKSICFLVLFERACYWFLITGLFLTVINVRMCYIDSEFYILEFYIFLYSKYR